MVVAHTGCAHTGASSMPPTQPAPIGRSRRPASCTPSPLNTQSRFSRHIGRSRRHKRNPYQIVVSSLPLARQHTHSHYRRSSRRASPHCRATTPHAASPYQKWPMTSLKARCWPRWQPACSGLQCSRAWRGKQRALGGFVHVGRIGGRHGSNVRVCVRRGGSVCVSSSGRRQQACS